MNAQLIAVDAKALDLLTAEVKALRQEVRKLKDGEMPEWVTVKAAASLLSVSEETIRRRSKRGLYETRRDGGKNILIRRESLVQSKS